MTYRISVIALTIATAVTFVPVMAHADSTDSFFDRTRNTSVSQRTPAGYEPLGLHEGAFNVAPKLDVGLERNDNIYYQQLDKSSDTILSLAPSVAVKSNWSRHEIDASLSADYNDFAKHSSEDTLSYDASVGGRLDIHGHSYAYGGADFSQNYEPRFDPSFPTAAAKPVKYDATQAQAGIVWEENRLKFEGQGTYAYFNYFDVLDKTGHVIDQDGRDYTGWTYMGRADYAVSPDTSIYLVYTGNTRSYREHLLQTLGTEQVRINRDSTGYDIAIGADFDLTNLIRGSFEIGGLKQNYNNLLVLKPGATTPTKAKDASGGAFKAHIEYFPTELTTVSFTANRAIEETPVLQSTGYLSTDLGVGVDHELLRQMVISASYDHIEDNYDGINRKDERSALNLGGRYLVSRNVTLRAGYTYSELTSKGSARITGFKDNALRVSLGLQY